MFVISKRKSVYVSKEPPDCKRVLVMTLWPRGVSKDKVDAWTKDVGTPRELIKKYKGEAIGWADFASQYTKSLKSKDEILRSLAAESKTRTITLLCTDKDPMSRHKSILRETIEKKV
jgi:uncharacterized protein YeaO (DUF488 family)